MLDPVAQKCCHLLYTRTWKAASQVQKRKVPEHYRWASLFVSLHTPRHFAFCECITASVSCSNLLLCRSSQRILRYLAGTRQLGILYKRGLFFDPTKQSHTMQAFSDADCAGEKSKRKFDHRLWYHYQRLSCIMEESKTNNRRPLFNWNGLHCNTLMRKRGGLD